MYEATVTIFNSYQSPTTDQLIWYPHVLTGVSIVTDKGQMLRQYGPDSTDAAELHVAFSGLSPSWDGVHDYAPTLDNAPASEWLSDDKKYSHIGEKFYYGDVGKNISRAYQFAYDMDLDEWKWDVSMDSLNIIVNGSTGQPMLNTMDEPLPWISPITWAKQVNDLLDDTITFKPGDLFWWGEWTDGPVSDEDYQDRRGGGFDAYMSKNYDYVFRITTIGGPYTGIPHFEIRGA